MQKSKVLIVDDTPKNIQVLGQILKEGGYNVLAATNGKDALSMIENRPPDLVLLDIMMPDMDGFEVLNKIQDIKGAEGLPVMFLTAKTDKDDLEKAFNLGAVDYVTKPYFYKEILARVRSHIALYQFTRELKKNLEEKQELLHILCHDLSNPISSAMLNAELGIRSAQNLNQRFENIVKILKNGFHVIDLIRTNLALEEGKTKIEMGAFSLNEMIQESLLILRGRFEEKEIEVLVQLEILENEMGHDRVIVEATSFINSVLNNILTNAIKFSEKGTQIKIAANLDGDKVRLSIRDQGMGIPKELLEILFSNDQATTRAGTDGEKGTGFGMPLLKKFVENYGGEIEIYSIVKTESSTDHGTSIEILLNKDD